MIKSGIDIHVIIIATGYNANVIALKIKLNFKFEYFFKVKKVNPLKKNSSKNELNIVMYILTYIKLSKLTPISFVRDDVILDKSNKFPSKK